MRDVMLDLETFGTKPGCVIRSIGGVFFDKNNMAHDFYVNVDKQSCIDVGLTVDPKTEAWWATQGNKAKDAFLSNPQPLFDALQSFKTWFEVHGGERVWAQGASFDPPVIEAAFDACKIAYPWKFWNIRDTRTLYDIAKFNPNNVKRDGTFHNALDDAKHQVGLVQTSINLIFAKNTIGEQLKGDAS